MNVAGLVLAAFNVTELEFCLIQCYCTSVFSILRFCSGGAYSIVRLVFAAYNAAGLVFYAYNVTALVFSAYIVTYICIVLLGWCYLPINFYQGKMERRLLAMERRL